MGHTWVKPLLTSSPSSPAPWPVPAQWAWRALCGSACDLWSALACWPSVASVSQERGLSRGMPRKRTRSMQLLKQRTERLLQTRSRSSTRRSQEETTRTMSRRPPPDRTSRLRVQLMGLAAVPAAAPEASPELDVYSSPGTVRGTCRARETHGFLVFQFRSPIGCHGASRHLLCVE